MRATAREIGISYEALRKAEKEGRVTPEGKDLRGFSIFDVEKTRKQLADNTDPSASERGRANGCSKEPPPQEDEQDPESLEGLNEDQTFGTLAAAKTHEAWLNVKKKRLNQKILEGKYIDKQEASAAWAGLMSDARSKLLSVGDSLSDVLAIEKDPITIKEMLDDYMRDILADLAKGSSFNDAVPVDSE